MNVSLLSRLHIKEHSAHVYRFLCISFLFTFIILLSFVFKAGDSESLMGLLYAFTIPTYYYLILLLIMTLLLPIFWWRNALWIVLIPKVLLDTLLVSDWLTFDVYRFHVDMLFINMVLYDFKGLGVSNALIAMAIGVFVVICAVNLGCYKIAYKMQSRGKKISAKKINITLFSIFILGQLTHVVGFEYKLKSITKYTPYVPYYAPLTSHSNMVKLQESFPAIFPAKVASDGNGLDDLLSSESSGLVKYPLAPLTCEIPSTQAKNNVLVFVVESWRQDTFDAEVTPFIHQFAAQNTQFDNHFSGGSVTVNGLFSLFYGLHPVYRDHMASAPFENQTLLTQQLEAQGYDVKSYTRSNLDRFSLKEMFFGNIANKNYFNPQHLGAVAADDAVVAEVIKDIQQPSEKPWFKFVFITATHHAYDYPESFTHFKPLPKNPEGYIFDKFTPREPFVNDYKNSVLYMDKQFSDLWTAIEAVNIADNTMAIVTSDHGEEFNDNNAGYWGHGSNFTEYQVAVPLILKQAKNNKQPLPQSVNKLTGHIDIVPTIFSQELGCANPTSDYSNGFSLINVPDDRIGMITASYKDKAYIIDGKVYATGLSVESYDLKDINKKNDAFNYPKLNTLKSEEYLFLKE